jgi:YVTN family beta-propeller protein
VKKLLLAFLLACDWSVPDTTLAYPAHSSSMALSPDGKTLYVVNPDADSVAVIDVAGRKLSREIMLAGAHPTVDASGNYTPAVMPRSVVLSPEGDMLYATGERSGSAYAIDLATGNQTVAHVCSEPVGLVASPDGAQLFVACSQDNTVLRLASATLNVLATANVPSEPFALGLDQDGLTLHVTHFLNASVTDVNMRSMTVLGTTTIADVAPRGDKRLAHGQPRGLYDVAARPSSNEKWIVHALLGTDTAQPDLDFESTTFPAATILGQATLSINAQDVPGINGAFADIVSGPHAIAFTHDGSLAFMVDQNSEDVLVIDARTQTQAALVRPLPGHTPEGIVLSDDDKFAFVQERTTNDVAVLAIELATNTITVEASTIPTLTSDPMPAQLRQGQQLFYSANSDQTPITRNHWVACATCHMEGRSDAVTWRFEQGPRDTPTNAGGLLGTGFLFRTADRNKVQDYWRTINIEQGGSFDPNDPVLAPMLDAIEAYVNHAIPLPVPPTTDPTLVARGETVFKAVGCSTCHSGARFTDSGSGNANLDLGGAVLLHDVGTCVSAPFADVAHDDIEGHPRAACSFDTPSLSGVASTPPYMHDGSAATLADAVSRMIAATHPEGISDDDKAALVEYLRSL